MISIPLRSVSRGAHGGQSGSSQGKKHGQQRAAAAASSVCSPVARNTDLSSSKAGWSAAEQVDARE